MSRLRSTISVALGVACLLGGCAHPEGSVEMFEGAEPTLDELGASVVAALSDSDVEALERVRLTEHEHNDVVWPELPAGRPEVNFPVDLAWANIQRRNHRDLNRLLARAAGYTLDFIDVDCRGEPQAFDSFLVLTDCYTRVRAEDGEVLQAQFFKDVLVRAGGHKLFRYYDAEFTAGMAGPEIHSAGGAH